MNSNQLPIAVDRQVRFVADMLFAAEMSSEQVHSQALKPEASAYGSIISHANLGSICLSTELIPSSWVSL